MKMFRSHVPAQIPEQHDEEMKKVLQSLNAHEMVIKAHTPQSEQSDHRHRQRKPGRHLAAHRYYFDDPPKTPDVDLSQIAKSEEKPAATSISTRRRYLRSRLVVMRNNHQKGDHGAGANLRPHRHDPDEVSVSTS